VQKKQNSSDGNRRSLADDHSFVGACETSGGYSSGADSTAQTPATTPTQRTVTRETNIRVIIGGIVSRVRMTRRRTPSLCGPFTDDRPLLKVRVAPVLVAEAARYEDRTVVPVAGVVVGWNSRITARS
jgi:hypothetical protein